MNIKKGEMKVCTRCGVEHPVESYHYANKAKGKRKTVCKDCSYLYAKEYIEKDPLAWHYYQKKYYSENPEKYPGNHKNKKIPPVAGVYVIECLLTDDKYVGCSRDLRHRKYQHSRNVGVSKNKPLAKLIKEYGWEAFDFRVIEECDREIMFERETHYIQIYQPNLNKNKI